MFSHLIIMCILVSSGVLSVSIFFGDMAWYFCGLLFASSSLRLRFPDCTNSRVAFVLCPRTYNILLGVVLCCYSFLLFVLCIEWTLLPLGSTPILYFLDIFLYCCHLFLVCSVTCALVLFFGFRLSGCMLDYKLHYIFLPNSKSCSKSVDWFIRKMYLFKKYLKTSCNNKLLKKKKLFFFLCVKSLGAVHIIRHAIFSYFLPPPPMSRHTS